MRSEVLKPPAKSVPLKNSNGARILAYRQLDPQIRNTVRTFVDSAVARHNQARSWAITTPNLRAGFPKSLERIILRSLERDPERRHANARQLGEELLDFLASESRRVSA